MRSAAGFPASSLDFEPCRRPPLLIWHHRMLQSLVKLHPYPPLNVLPSSQGSPSVTAAGSSRHLHFAGGEPETLHKLEWLAILIEHGRILEPALPTAQWSSLLPGGGALPGLIIVKLCCLALERVQVAGDVAHVPAVREALGSVSHLNWRGVSGTMCAHLQQWRGTSKRIRNPQSSLIT